MTGYESKRAAAQDKMDDDGNALTIAYQSGYYDGKKAALTGQEQNFCPRCGKRTKDIHTCTPPPQRTWVGLSEQQQSDIEDASEMMIGIVAFSLISDTLKEKNT